MEQSLRTYYDFADNDFQFLTASYKNGLVANAMGALAQQICEKYLKHLVDVYIVPDKFEENQRKEDMLRTHNLNKLAKYITASLPDIQLDKQALNVVNGLYFTTRYPGDESIVIDKNDIEEYIDAVKKCKQMVDNYIVKMKKTQ